MPHAYDLVDTLANVSYPGENITSIIYQPRGAFVIVTAQSTGSHEHLYNQINEQFPNCTRIHTVKTGTDRQEGERKAAVLKRIGAHSYTDNNINILQTIQQLLPSIDLYVMKNGRRRPL